jgi:serine/threonine protein kinase
MKTATTGTTRDIDIVRTSLEPDYLVLEELGRGGMAIVYRAREKELDREVAIKVLPSAMAMDGDFVDRFQREARTAGQLEHPNIVPIYRVGRAGNVTYFVMKLLRGQSLAAVLRERGKLDSKEVRHILVETASALGFAAKRGVVHRDIKPDNILLDHEGRCVVTDFGIAKTQSGPLTAQGISMGTPRYMSPEHAQGTPVDGRSDMYSLGVVAYQCLTGTTPFNADDPFAILYKHINEPLPQPTLKTKEERALFSVVSKMLEKKPEDRFQDANELLEALGIEVTAPTLAATTQIRPKALTPTQVMITPVDITGARRFIPRDWRVWAIAGGVILLGVTALFASRDKPPRATPPASIATLTPALVTAPPPVPKEPYSACPRLDSARATRPAAFQLLLDAVKAQKPGAKLTVTYDVCGLPKDSGYRAEITVSKPRRGGIGGVFNRGPQPVTMSFNEKVRSPRSRRSKTMDISSLGSGAATLNVVVTDTRGRRKEASRQLQILDK